MSMAGTCTLALGLLWLLFVLPRPKLALAPVVAGAMYSVWGCARSSGVKRRACQLRARGTAKVGGIGLGPYGAFAVLDCTHSSRRTRKRTTQMLVGMLGGATGAWIPRNVQKMHGIVEVHKTHIAHLNFGDSHLKPGVARSGDLAMSGSTRNSRFYIRLSLSAPIKSLSRYGFVHLLPDIRLSTPLSLVLWLSASFCFGLH
ncbi:hypothetical protein K438DRAFT_1782895 [Mycena galopus ATCC 62051]|nr:hypothetical protein K438DRAFT_1782895 [Mycena galopus ATCC 62051]